MATTILIVAAIVGIQPDSDQHVPPTDAIPVVVRWEDLTGSSPIALSDNITIRLGIQSDRCRVGDGLLLYVLTDGYSPADRRSGSNRVGPVRVEIGENEAIRAVEKSLHAAADLGDVKGRLLSATVVPMRRLHPVQVCVRTLDGRIIGQRWIATDPQAYHAWMPLMRSRDERDTSQSPLPVLANRANGRALPDWDSMRPVVFQGAGYGRQISRSLKEPLPTLVPDKPNSDWEVTTHEAPGGERHIVITSEKEDFLVARPDWHLLARWWVNGEAFVPAELDSLFSDQNGLVIQGRRLEFQLDVDLRRLAAQAGDRIALQLMYLEDGWRWLAEVESLQARHGGKPRRAVLLNRVQWTAAPRTGG